MADDKDTESRHCYSVGAVCPGQGDAAAGRAGVAFVAFALTVGLSLIALGGLLFRYNRALAQWRAVLVAWLGCCALWLPGMQFRSAQASSILANLNLLVMILFLDALLASLFAIVALAIRRDVSVAYVVIFYALGAPLLRNAVNAAGGVLTFFQGLTGSDLFAGFNVVKLALPGLSCMITCGFLTFLPHLIWSGIKELRGR